MKLYVCLIMAFSLLPYVECRGKTYDDLDDIIKHQAEGKIESRSSHQAYVAPTGDGAKIDPSMVVHKHKVEESAATQ
jgi:hypothetical protein